ncbi:MAG: hypothetical protein AAF432_02670 [Planctomycetota bacterium]
MPEPQNQSDAPPTLPSSAESAREERVSSLVGDRFCTDCGYNLMGQPVLREPHYNMLIVRCPECGTIAAPQEYPLAGRWTNRFVSAGAVLLLLFSVAFFGATNLLMLGPPAGFASGATWRMNNQYMYTAMPGQPATALNELGWSQVEWPILLWLWIPFTLSFLLGVTWRVLLSHWPAKRLLNFILIEALVLFGWIGVTWTASFREYQSTSYNEDWVFFGIPIWLGAVAICWLLLSIGLRFGKPVARGILCALLAPRLRGPFQFLWEKEGIGN